MMTRAAGERMTGVLAAMPILLAPILGHRWRNRTVRLLEVALSGNPPFAFLVEDELKRLGGIFEKAPNWQPFAIVDGRLITGQNPASSTVAAQALLKMVGQKAA